MVNLSSNVTMEKLVEFGYDCFCNEEYINNIVSTGDFSTHGSCLWESDGLFHQYQDEYPNAFNDDSEAKKLLTQWLPVRIRYIAKSIMEEMKLYKYIYRMCYLSPEHVDYIRRNRIGLHVDDCGVYWSTRLDTDAYNVVVPEVGHLAVRLKAYLLTGEVDWYETFVSRIDYNNGDHEQEFRLWDDAIVTIVDITTRKPRNI